MRLEKKFSWKISEVRLKNEQWNILTNTELKCDFQTKNWLDAKSHNDKIKDYQLVIYDCRQNAFWLLKSMLSLHPTCDFLFLTLMNKLINNS